MMSNGKHLICCRINRMHVFIYVYVYFHLRRHSWTDIRGNYGAKFIVMFMSFCWGRRAYVNVREDFDSHLIDQNLVHVSSFAKWSISATSHVILARNEFHTPFGFGGRVSMRGLRLRWIWFSLKLLHYRDENTFWLHSILHTGCSMIKWILGHWNDNLRTLALPLNSIHRSKG